MSKEENPSAALAADCRMCGEDVSVANPVHLKWCEQITRPMYDRYQRVFREVYNIIELSLDVDKAKIAKDLVGNKLMEAREDSIDLVVNYFKKDSKI